MATHLGANYFGATAVHPPTQPLELLLPIDQTPVSTADMWRGMCATLVVMTIIGLWFVGVL